MSAAFLAYPAWVVAVITIAAMLAVTFSALILVRRFVALDRLQEHNEIAGFIFSAVAVMYAVLLAFVVIVVWEEFGKAEDIVRTEVSAADSLYQEVGAYPTATTRGIRAALLTYANDIVTDEWPKMETGERSEATDRALTSLTKLVESVVPRGERDQLIYPDTLVLVHALLEERDKRLDLNSRGIPSIMWWTLIAGAAITLAFALFFGAASVHVHFLFTGMFVAVIGVMFTLIVQLNFPFRGDTSVTSASWQMLIERIHVRAGAG
jgi:hypothetical protein